ncbi:helicase [Spirochaetia bacterium]|nr:helicase [Spirochaetia bacterium]
MDTAVMIDGAFIRKKFRSAKRRDISAPEIQQFVINTLGILNIPDRNYRVYFYDCKPCSERTSLPITHGAYNFDANPQYAKGVNLIKEIKLLPFFAVREGMLSFNGWTLKPSCYGMNPLTDSCFIPNLKQKGVDIKIGLDVAWVSFNRIASSIIFISLRESGRGLIQSGKTC